MFAGEQRLNIRVVSSTGIWRSISEERVNGRVVSYYEHHGYLELPANSRGGGRKSFTSHGVNSSGQLGPTEQAKILSREKWAGTLLRIRPRQKHFVSTSLVHPAARRKADHAAKPNLVTFTILSYHTFPARIHVPRTYIDLLLLSFISSGVITAALTGYTMWKCGNRIGAQRSSFSGRIATLQPDSPKTPTNQLFCLLPC